MSLWITIQYTLLPITLSFCNLLFPLYPQPQGCFGLVFLSPLQFRNLNNVIHVFLCGVEMFLTSVVCFLTTSLRLYFRVHCQLRGLMNNQNKGIPYCVFYYWNWDWVNDEGRFDQQRWRKLMLKVGRHSYCMFQLYTGPAESSSREMGKPVANKFWMRFKIQANFKRGPQNPVQSGFELINEYGVRFHLQSLSPELIEKHKQYAIW